MSDCCPPTHANPNETDHPITAPAGTAPRVPADAPATCSLSDVELDGRRRRWTQLVAAAAIDRERGSGVLRARFRSDEATRAELEELLVLERQCCAHLRWGVSEGRDGLYLTVMGDDGELDGLGPLAALPSAAP